ncbi:MAG: hypothetical protein JNK48_25720 [Bryobacterales bacterium]|nr:hypothetical protein [Bryobacterales bacterium]
MCYAAIASRARVCTERAVQRTPGWTGWIAAAMNAAFLAALARSLMAGEQTVEAARARAMHTLGRRWRWAGLSRGLCYAAIASRARVCTERETSPRRV